MKQLTIARKILQLVNHGCTWFTLANIIKLLAGYTLFSASLVTANPLESSVKSNQPAQLNVGNVPGTIVLSRFEIIGNQVIPESEIEQLLQPYLFRPISFAELMEIQQVITKLYVERGYFTSGAYIPPQTIKNRTIKIKIIQGSIEEIKIYGLKRLSPSYIRQRIAIATQPPLNQEKLLNALQLLQLDPLIKNISAELSKGVNPGSSFLQVEVEEADHFFTELTIDNYRTPNIGSFSRQLALGHDNLLGFGDRLDVSYVNTNGSNSLENLSYAIPLGADNKELKLTYSLNQSSIITETFQDLDLASNNRYFNLSYRQPLVHTPSQELAVGLIFSNQYSQLSLMDIGFPNLARGSDVEGITQISALRLFQEYSDRSDTHVFALRSQFSIGIDAFDATTNPDDIPDSIFLIWRGQAQYLKMLNSSSNILLRCDLQLADRGLVSLEQFSSGGALSVRGYTQDRILGDNGLFLSAELINTVWSTPEGNIALELNPFFDFGRVWNSDELTSSTNTLASFGLGLQFLIRDTLTARLDWGIPLIEDDDLPGNSLQESGVYFSVKFKPF